ncbi:UDP-glycosyltransferase 86A1 [Sesamum alatum]|uniref:UDP-glycosyltransferase 86A1 n=1 Tax=Sesamum alatum TaxID=300844 RepID=A0AAE1XX66_9LAMI|nr:UDP-glycosyltransferase 86A1 [Sesamum alatum]
MAEIHRKPHAIMISVPYQGHINPFVNLALKIASNGFSITFVHFEFVHHRLSKAHHCNKTQVDIFSKARESGLDIRYTTISDGLPLEFDRDANYDEFWGRVLSDFPARVDEFVGKTIQSDPYLVHFLVADTVFSWPATIAEKYNLVNVSLWTEPALVFTLGYHLDLLRENGHFPCKDDIDEEVNYVPGIKSINARDLISVFKESEQGHYTMVKSAIMTFEQPNYAIGPVNFFKNLPTYTVSKSLWSESDCTQWLETKPPGSVLYVSFGSFVHTSRQVIEEIAYGLLLSEVNFIWVVREGILSSGDTNIMPDGYEDEVKDKGLIIPWCNQIRVLSNPAVGGFLTHNGWNSTIESMWCGVPMICYPFLFDQPTNRKLVVDDWKCGISLCDGTISVDRKKVAEKIKSFMSGAAAKSFCQEANKVKTILHHALEVDGSSERNFNQFIKDLKEKIHSTTTNIE